MNHSIPFIQPNGHKSHHFRKFWPYNSSLFETLKKKQTDKEVHVGTTTNTSRVAEDWFNVSLKSFMTQLFKVVHLLLKYRTLNLKKGLYCSIYFHWVSFHYSNLLYSYYISPLFTFCFCKSMLLIKSVDRQIRVWWTNTDVSGVISRSDLCSMRWVGWKSNTTTIINHLFIV